MRLTEHEVTAIKNAVASYDPDAVIYLYGSRVDDTKHGGDIDLLVLSEKIDLETKIQIRLKIYDAIGEQKIDMLVKKQPDTAFAKLAIEEGIKL